MTGNFKPDMLPPCERANIRFIASQLTQACQQLHASDPKLSPDRCYATDKGMEVAEPGGRATAVLHIVDQKDNTPVICELVSDSTGENIDCTIRKIEASIGCNLYEISYRGRRHQLHIKVEGEHIKGSPFPVTVKLGTQIKIIKGLNVPWGVAVNRRGEVLVAESGAHCISIFSPTGEKIQSFGSKGSGHGQLNSPRSVAVDDDGNILVVDERNYRIQKFTPDGNFIMSVGNKGSNPLEFNEPIGIAIHPLNKRVYIADHGNNRVQILNPDLTFSSSLGSEAQFTYPWDVACDSIGNIYVADTQNYRIQVFTAEGELLRKFGMESIGDGKLIAATSISIDKDNVIYVTDYFNHRVSIFTCEGKFLSSFGTCGIGPGELHCPRGIAVDKNGVVYVSDTDNNRIQIY
jgi:tripartite motif-containing protein 2/3/tripartite motif-containing protein 71